MHWMAPMAPYYGTFTLLERIQQTADGLIFTTLSLLMTLMGIHFRTSLLPMEEIILPLNGKQTDLLGI